MTQPTYTISITAIKTTTVGKTTDVVKQIDWTIKGELAGQNFELPKSTIIPDPDGTKIAPLSSLTAEKVIAWIEQHEPNMDAIKAHLQYVLEKQVSEAALKSAPLPWMPVTEPVVAPPSIS